MSRITLAMAQFEKVRQHRDFLQGTLLKMSHVHLAVSGVS